jgi:hypothetical protein
MDGGEKKRAYHRAYYAAHKEAFRRKRRKYELGLRQIILEAKRRPCVDCGGTWDPLVMEFDHCRGVKRFNLGDFQGARRHGREAVLKEIQKCEVVCPTCHRIRTLRRKGLLL